MRVTIILTVAAIGTLLAAVAPGAVAQAVPEGACEIPGGRWCWPIEPTGYGQPCQCTDEDGQSVRGITR